MGDWDALGIDTRGKTTGQVKTLCPRCSHTRRNKRDRCLSVNLDEGLYHCHHCDWSGTVNDRRDAYGTPPRPRRETPPAYTKPEYPPQDGALDPAATEWLAGRGITPEVWGRNQIGYRDGAITYPYLRGEEVVNVKHRGRGKRFWMVAGAELTLYGLNDIAPGRPLVWVEGEMDKLAVEVAGIEACVSIPNGAPAPGTKDYARHFAYLEPLRATLEAVERHIIAVDDDPAGRTLADELIRRLGPERCWRVSWPAGRKDANEVLTGEGAAALRAALDSARPVPLAGLFEVSDLYDDVLDLYEHGMDGGAHPGSERLAPFYRVKPGLWTLVTGIPGHGKSAVLDWLMVNLAKRHGWHFAICSPENQPLARHVGQLAQIWSGRPFGRGPHRRMTQGELVEALALLHDHFIFLLPPDDEGYAIDAILRLAKAAVYRRGIRGFVIDPWNELEHTRPAGMSETEHTSQVLTKIRRFARAHGVHVWLVAHPTKLVKDKDGNYPVPTPYDVSGSAHFRNKADMALSIWRDVNDASAPTQVHIQKVRFRESGQVGMVDLWYDALTGRYSDLGPVTHRYEERDPWDTDEESA
jgi:twinkle protein